MASFFSSLPWSVLDMNTTGCLAWLRAAEMATSDTSHSTLNGKLLSIGFSAAASSSCFICLNALSAFISSGNFAFSTSGRILLESYVSILRNMQTYQVLLADFEISGGGSSFKGRNLSGLGLIIPPLMWYFKILIDRTEVTDFDLLRLISTFAIASKNFFTFWLCSDCVYPVIVMSSI